MNRLIRIYTVCHSVFDFRLKPLFASVDMSKFNDSSLQKLRNERIKTLKKTDSSLKYSVSVDLYTRKHDKKFILWQSIKLNLYIFTCLSENRSI